MVRLSDLQARFGGELRGLGTDPELAHVELDSRRVGRGALFCALSGARVDGAQFAAHAQDSGAAAVLCERPLDGVDLPQWVHRDARKATGEAASLVYGEPSERLRVLAVTGTNGKTTVAWLAAQLLEHCGMRPALLGTVGARVAGGELEPLANTTPDATSLQRAFAAHLAAGGDTACIEASSHALVQERLSGTRLAVAVFTNLTRDHLDFHGDMERYAEAKSRLFARLDEQGAAVVNADDPASQRMTNTARARAARVVSYGIGSRADLSALDVRVDRRGNHLTLDGMGISKAGSYLPLTGRHNVENALAALAAVLLMGASPSAALEGLATVSPAPGRLEQVPARRCTVLVDYAHTEDALGSVLRALKDVLAESDSSGRLLCVFGCGGDRDPGKRAPMGAHANELCDVVVVTSDNSRNEDPEAIAAEILAGCEPRRCELHVELDRRRAIELAAELAGEDDLVLIAGKGHETEQIFAGGRREEFDDRAVAREAFA